MHVRWRWWLVAAATVTVPVYAGTAWHHVAGRELPTMFIDHELADSVHYAYRFHGDGTISGFNMGKKLQGVWHIAGDEICWTLKRRRAEEECFELERNGASIRLLRDGQPAFIATLKPIRQSATETGR